MAENDTTETAANEASATDEATTETTKETAAETFSREYVEDLRKENASYRVRSKTFESAFDGYDEEQQQGWLELISQFSQDRTIAAAQMKEVAEQILADQEEAGVKGDDKLTKAEVQKMIKAEAESLQQAQLVSEIEAEAKALGYTPRSEDLDTRLDYEDLCNIAMSLPDYSLAKAHELLEARKQKQIDAYLKAKQEAASGTPKAPVAGGAAPSQEKEVKVSNFEDAGKSALSKLKALREK